VSRAVRRDAFGARKSESFLAGGGGFGWHLVSWREGGN
jgi:hypothetical protein